MHFLVLSVLILFSLSIAKEIFTEQTIKQYLNQQNPFIYTLIGKKYINQGKLKYYEGFFDTKLKGKYEKKEYPVSEGLFYSIFVEKPIYNGIDFSFGYRKAKGVQEYNNIKTGKDGELLLGLKIPILNIKQNIDKRRLNLFLTDLELKKVDFEYQNKFRKLYLKILTSYYKTLYYKKVLDIEKNLLRKSEKRKEYIVKKIKEGLLPTVYQIEAEQHIIHRQQRVLKAKNDFTVQLNKFLKYLNIDSKTFLKKYDLPDLPEPKDLKISLDEAVKLALQNRPDLKEIKLEKERLQNEKKFYTLLKYPKINLSLYGVYDFNYDSGYKVSLNAVYSVERRKYLGKSIEIRKKDILLDKKQEKILIEIKTNLKNIIQTLNTLKENIKMAQQEISLLKKLEKVERTKLKLGSGNLYFVNKREIDTLKAKKKNLKYKLEYITTYRKFFIELNIF